MWPHLHRRGLRSGYKDCHSSEADGEKLTNYRSVLGRGNIEVILLTTSRRPTPRIRTFCRELTRSIPNVVRINRGKLSLNGMAEKALEFEADRVVVVDRWMSALGKIKLFKIGLDGLMPVSPTMYVAGMKLKREFESTKNKLIQSLVITMSPEESTEAAKIARSLSNFLKIPMLQIGKAVLYYEISMHVSLDDLDRIQVTFMLLLPETVEIGPRITLSHVVWGAKR